MDRKQRMDRGKLWLFLPLLVLPFLALGFYALGGGRGNAEDEVSVKAGLNTSLPDASFSKDSLKSKSEYYDQAERVAARSDTNGIALVAEKLGFGGLGVGGGSVSGLSQTQEIEGKLSAIQREISRAEEPVGRSTPIARSKDVGMKSEVDRLEMLMRSMQQGKGEDAEMAQLNQLMQGILDVQHPGRLLERERLAGGAAVLDSQFRACPAVVWGRQKVANGGTVRLKLMDSLRVSGMLLQRGQELFGVCRVANQRLLVEVKHLRLGTSIVPVDLSVYGLDGMPGIRAPDAQLSEAMGSGSEQAMRGLGLGGYDASVAVQVAGAGIDAARGLLSKKVRRLRVKLEGGLQVLLRDNGRK